MIDKKETLNAIAVDLMIQLECVLDTIYKDDLEAKDTLSQCFDTLREHLDPDVE